jgi:alkylated DNA repair dioxygenase AlkB
VAREPTVTERPEGLEYRPDLVSEDEERALVALLGELELREFTMRGQTARRTVRHFGYDYDYEAYGKVTPSEPLPESLAWLRDRCADFAQLPPEELVQTLVTRYPPGAPIGWHRDAPMFGAKVVGVSLLSASRMRLQRRAGGVRRVFELELPPRSGYVLGGAARSAWQHSIPPVKSLRYSITFRTLKGA